MRWIPNCGVKRLLGTKVGLSIRSMGTAPGSRTAPRPRLSDLWLKWSGVSVLLGLVACVGSGGFRWNLLDVRSAGPRVESAMVWDPTRGVFVLYGGRDRNWDLRPEIWEWSPNSRAWRVGADASRPNPGARGSHVMVWDTGRERMILFGGTDFDRYFNDTWAFDGSASE